MNKLRPYQERGRDFLVRKEFAILGDVMRLGKTPQAIRAAICADIDRLWVVCPAGAVSHWQEQILQWGYCNDFSVMSYDTCVVRQQLIKKWFNSFQPQAIIFDEAHYLKRHTSKRTKLFIGKEGLAHQADYVWFLTGTPITRTCDDLYPMLHFLDEFKGTYDEFVERYCTYGNIKIGRKWLKKVWGTTRNGERRYELRSMIKRVMLRRKLSDVMDDIGLEPQLNIIPVQDSVERDRCDYSEEDVELLDEGKLPQETRIEVAKSKIPYLVRDIRDNIESGAYKQTVVFAWHKEVIAELHKELRQANLKTECITGGTSQAARDAYIRDFHAGDIQVLIGNILAAGTAIDLSATHYGYFLELDYLPSNNKQASYRLLNLQKKEPSMFDVLVLPDSNDERIVKTLVKRTREIKELLN